MWVGGKMSMTLHLVFRISPSLSGGECRRRNANIGAEEIFKTLGLMALTCSHPLLSQRHLLTIVRAAFSSIRHLWTNTGNNICLHYLFKPMTLKYSGQNPTRKLAWGFVILHFDTSSFVQICLFKTRQKLPFQFLSIVRWTNLVLTKFELWQQHIQIICSRYFTAYFMSMCKLWIIVMAKW
jgi:hypothetical protein